MLVGFERERERLAAREVKPWPEREVVMEKRWREGRRAVWEITTGYIYNIFF